MNTNIKFDLIIKNIFKNRVYLGVLLGSILSLVLLIIVYYKFIAPTFYTQMMNNVTDEAKRIGNHIKWHQSEKINLRLLEKLRSDFSLYKIRLFDKDGRIILSTKLSEVGNLSTYKYFKTILPKGDLYYKIDQKTIVDKKTGLNKTIQVAEIYVPIMINSSFNGASEIYFDITEHKENFEILLDNTFHILASGAIIFLSFIFVILYFSSKNNLIEKNKEIMLFEQSKLASLGEMIGNIAHQWRQPLSMISTSITTLKVKKEMGIMDDKDFEETVNNIVNSSDYLSQTIDDFRNFFDKNKKAIKINMKDLVNSTISIVSDNLKNHSIKIVTNLDDIESEILENELKQVLINILNNAKDAFESSKNKDLKDRLIFIDVSKNDGKVEITIKDNAGGINPAILQKIFEPYFTTKHKSIGTGIGLYMCKTIIENNMKGKILVSNSEYSYENKEYLGAVFTIII